MLEILLADEAIDEDLVAKMLSWQHCGFSVDDQVRIEAGDAQGRQQLACYMIRAALYLDKTEYKADPLVCPHCGAELRFLSVIVEPLVIERILRHLGLWDPRPPSQAQPESDDWPVNGQIPLTYEPLPAIA